MKIETQMWITLVHLVHITHQVKWIQYSQSIRKHETLNLFILQCINQLINVLWRILDSITPIF